MAGKVIAVDLDEAAHALKLLSEYLPGGGGLVCRVGVLGAEEGAVSHFHARLSVREQNLSKVVEKISLNIQTQHRAIVEAVNALVAADDSLREGAADLLLQIDAMADSAARTAETRSAFERASASSGSQARSSER